MIYFYTERTDHNVTLPKASPQEILEYCSNLDLLGLDCEFNRLDPYTATLLLLVIGDEHVQYVIDCTSVDISFLQPLDDKTFIGHNIKIDYKMCKVNGFTFNRVEDTMITEQRLGLGSDRRNGLNFVVERRLNKKMSKEVRADFQKMVKSSTFDNKHIEYAAGDIEYLFGIRETQLPLIAKLDMSFLLYGIEFPLIPIMGDCDLEGFIMDDKAWLENVKVNKTRKRELELAMDEELRILIAEHRPDLLAGKYGRERKHQIVEQGDLFGPPKSIESKNLGNIQWTSNAQVKKLFKDLELPVPTKKDKETVQVDILEEYMLVNPDSPLIDLLRLYIQFSAVNKEISTYGEKFLRMKNPITGKIHTVFRHCSTDTGRFSSGDSKSGFPNLQNIPAHKKFRHCFGVEEGYEVTTCDLSGAELIVMCALSGDMRLLELSKGDMHSHMANLCWRKIYEHRREDYTEDLEVSKDKNKDKRTAFKPMTFGTIYGMRGKKAGQQLHVSEIEGEIVVKTIAQEIPDVFRMVERAGKDALMDGYVVHNTRTNSRRWFTPVLDARKELRRRKREDPYGTVTEVPFYLENHRARPEHLMKFMDKVKCESAARNTRIQGTQADMVKEAIVEIDKHIKDNNWELILLGTVHDELIYKHPIGYTVKCPYRAVDVPVGDYIAHAMTEVANRYLDGVKMGAEYETMDTWTK